MRYNRPHDIGKFLVPRRGGWPPVPPNRRRLAWRTICVGSALALLFAAACGGGIVWFTRTPQTADAAVATKAPTREPGRLAILCDSSDHLSETQAEHARRVLLDEVLGQLVSGDHLIVAQLGETAEMPLRVLFSGRDPGRAGPCNPLTCSEAGATRRKEVARRDEGLIVPFRTAVQRCFLPGIRARTPLVEGLFRLSQHPDFTETLSGPRRLFLLTDGLQNMPEASLYERAYAKRGGKKRGEFSLFTPEGRRYVARYIALLHSADVVVLRIMRNDGQARQDWRAKEWLEDYLAESGARPPIQIRDLW